MLFRPETAKLCRPRTAGHKCSIHLSLKLYQLAQCGIWALEAPRFFVYFWGRIFWFTMPVNFNGGNMCSHCAVILAGLWMHHQALVELKWTQESHGHMLILLSTISGQRKTHLLNGSIQGISFLVSECIFFDLTCFWQSGSDCSVDICQLNWRPDIRMPNSTCKIGQRRTG